MDMTDLLLGLYGVIAALAMLMTHAEQRAKGMDRAAPILAGYVACVAWPALVFAVMVTLLVRRPVSA